MTCAELEILLCDYVDGTLHAGERTALESHLSGCPACTQLARDIAGVTAFIERVPEPNPPAELMTRILHYAPTGRRAAAEERTGVLLALEVRRVEQDRPIERDGESKLLQHLGEYPIGDQFAVHEHAIAIEDHQAESLFVHLAPMCCPNMS